MTIGPQISVLMSVYNGACHLREATESILAQTFDDFEFIIIDDGSTDRTPAVLDSYTDPRIVRLRNLPNIGLTRSLNRGLAEARGVYVARQDADDRSRPERFERQISFLKAHPDVAVLGTAHVELGEDGRMGRTQVPPLKHAEISEKLLYEGSQFCHGSIMGRRACLEAVGGYDERFLGSEDLDLFIRLSERFQLANLSDPLYELRIWPGSVTETLRATKREILPAIMAETLRRRDDCPPPPQVLGRLYWRLGLYALADKHETKARHYVNQALEENPDLDQDGVFLIRKALHIAFEIGPAGRIRHKSPEDVAEGIAFVQALFELLPANMARTRARQRWALGELHAAYAFAAHDAGDARRTRQHCWRAWRSDRAHLGNRGLLSIFVRSALGC